MKKILILVISILLCFCICLLNLLKYNKDVNDIMPVSFDNKQNIAFKEILREKEVEEISFDWGNNRITDVNEINEITLAFAETTYSQLDKKDAISIMKKESRNNAILFMRAGTLFENKDEKIDFSMFHLMMKNENIYLILEKFNISPEAQKNNNGFGFSYEVYKADKPKQLQAVIDRKTNKSVKFIGIAEAEFKECKLNIAMGVKEHLIYFLPSVISIILLLSVIVFVLIKKNGGKTGDNSAS